VTLPATTAANAAFLGWLPLAAVNAVFVTQVAAQLNLRQRVLHHLYDAGYVLGLAAASWLIVRLLWRLPHLVLRAGVSCVLVFAASYALLGGDLESFIERHPDSTAPWRLLFAAAVTIGLAILLSVGRLVARSAWRLRGHSIGAALVSAAGLALAISNHLVLLLDYPGTHFILAFAGASLIGIGALRFVPALESRRFVRPVRIALSALSVLSYVVVPGPVVRSALVSSTGAVAAPFVAQAWSRLRSGLATVPKAQSQWFKPRRGLPPIPAERLPGKPSAPIVIMLTIDALRSDIVERAKYKAAVPNLRAMSEKSLRFKRVWSPAACTGPTLKQFFLGTYTSQLMPKIDRGPYLVGLLTAGGVHTVHLLTHDVLKRGNGIGEGFSEERDIGSHAPARKVVKEVLAQLPEGVVGPLFIYSHILDAHSPYTSGALKQGRPKDRYVSEVALVDASIGTLRRELQERKLNDRIYLIVTADHGEAFMEHGRNYHARTQYEEMIRIPLLIEGPGVKARRVNRSVSLLDVSPTLLSLFGLSTPAHYMGESLVPFMRGATPRFTRPLATDGHDTKQAMLFNDRMKAIIDNNNGTEELYDLQTDPAETRNLAQRVDAAEYFDPLRAFFESLEKPPR
jgi:hypothetical protein